MYLCDLVVCQQITSFPSELDVRSLPIFHDLLGTECRSHKAVDTLLFEIIDHGFHERNTVVVLQHNLRVSQVVPSSNKPCCVRGKFHSPIHDEKDFFGIHQLENFINGIR